ncbi:SUMO1 sentrin specific peptidase 8 [Dermatophagoides farinae]|uniref:SUMO1 sentrin specific peptidase 8 n=1 Tax=Dermatophagoides farinae TaxID=6954 RepID=A0A922L1X0_DERFA|nr:SUMO1 sentrin specific peptidase 8 [Dermatophagoides farinae]
MDDSSSSVNHHSNNNHNSSKKEEFNFPKALKDNQSFPELDSNKKSKDIFKQLESLRKVAENLKEDDWCHSSLNKYLGLQ